MSASFKALAALALLVSCTLTRTEEASCTKNADCRSAFGAGYMCTTDTGLCKSVPPPARCQKTFPEDYLARPENYKGAITFGSLADRSLDTQEAREEAITLATRQVNEQNGLDGKQFGIVFCDVAENVEYDSDKREVAAVKSAQYLADVLGVPAVIGPSASGDALAVFDATRAQNLLLISPAASSPELTGHDIATATDETPGLLWRTAAPDTLQGAAIARHLIATRAADKNVVVIFEQGPYGDALSKVFATAFTGEDRTVKTFPFSNVNQRDEALIEAPKATPTPAIILFFSSQTNDAVALLNIASGNRGYDGKTLFLSDSAANPDLLSSAAQASSVFPRVVGSRPALPEGTTYELFKASFSAAFRKDPTSLQFVPNAYDAAWLAFYGAAWSLRQEKAITSIGMARGLRKISAKSEPISITPGNWTKVIDALGAGTAVNVNGASGTLDYTSDTEETTGLINIWKISTDGRSIEPTITIDPAAAN